MFPTDFARTIDPGKLAGTTAPKGLALVDEVIAKVIAALDEQIGYLAGFDLEADGHIASAALGAGDVSQRLAWHYARAHQVMVEDLKSVEREIKEFHAAVIDARKIARDNDERTGEEIAALARMTRDLGVGDDRGAPTYVAGQVPPAETLLEDRR